MPLSELDKLILGAEPEEEKLSGLDQALLGVPVKEPIKEPTWWEKGWGVVTEIPSTTVENLRKFNELAGEVLPPAPKPEDMAVTFARFLPGQEDFPDWDELSAGQKTLVLGQVASIIPLAIAGIHAGMGGIEAIKGAIRTHRIKGGKFYAPPTRAEALKEAAKKVEITRGFAVKEPEVRLKPIKPARGVPTKIVETAIKQLKQSVAQVKIVKIEALKGKLENTIYKAIEQAVPGIEKARVQEGIRASISKHLIGAPVEVSPRFAKATIDSVFNDFPVMLEQVRAYGQISPALFEAVTPTPEEEIVEREIVRPLTPTPEEYATPEVAPKFEPRDIAYLKGQTVGGLANNKHIWEDAKVLGYKEILALKNKKILELTDNELETLSAWAMSWEMTPYTARAGRTLDAAIVDIKTARGLYGKPKVAPKAEIPKEEPEILAEEITPEVKLPTEPAVPPTPPPTEMPEFVGEPVEDPITKLNELIKAAKPLRGKLEKAYTAERGKRIAEVEKFIDETIDTVGGEEGYRMILSKLKGELAPPEMKIAFEPIKEKLTEEQLKSLYVRTWKHPYLSEWEKVSAADGLTNLLMGGIPQPKKLVLLEEVYGSELIKSILSKRVWGAKATDFLIEAANVPRAALATADMSAFLRQGVIELAAHPVVSAKAIGKTFEFAFKPESFKQYFVDLRKDPLYPLMRKSGLSITDPARAGMQEREEAFISRFLQKIPIVKIPVEFAERAYVGFLNKVRVDLFKTWADELLSKGHTPTKDPELFKSAADVVNTFTGRGSLGRAGNRITPQLNTLFFSPRLIAARFNALNPVWYAKQPKEIRKKAIGDIAKFVVAGLTVLALVKTYKEATGASDDEISVETDTRSSDAGKIRVGNTRFDIWGGFQQWVRVFTQLITGERKNTKTGEIISLTKEEYPFTTRKEVLLRFMEGKLAPVPQLVNELISGAKTFGGEDITPEYVAKSKFVPMYIQDIAEAYKDGGLGRAVGVSIPAFFGVGVQTWEPRKKKGRRYWWE